MVAYYPKSTGHQSRSTSRPAHSSITAGGGGGGGVVGVVVSSQSRSSATFAPCAKLLNDA